MPYMVNGIGTTIIPARGYITWGKAAAVDSVQWFVIFLIPIVPYKCVHAFNWIGNQYLAVPIRWSMGMVIRSALRSWFEVIGLVSAMFAIVGAIFWIKEGLTVGSVICTVGTLFCIGTCVLGFLVWGWTDQRARSIRYLLGVHNAGSSDPVSWLDDMRGTIRDPSEIYGTHTFAEAVGVMLAQGEYSRAMWAARLTAALEYPEEGERLTDQVLDDPGVRSALS